MRSNSQNKRGMSARSVAEAKGLIMGGLLLFIETDRDDLSVVERISAAMEVMSNEESVEKECRSGGAVLH